MSTITEKLKWLIEADATSAISAFKKTGDAAEKELKKAEGAGKNLGGTLTKVGAGSLAVAGIVGGALVKAAGSFEDLALKAGHLADATGLSVDQASRWIEVSDDMGIGADTIETALGKMNKTLGNTPDLFDKLGIHIATTKSGAEDVNGTFLNTIERLNRIEDPARRAAAAAQIFGKGWQGSAELLKLSTDDIKKQLQSVSDQKVISDEELQKAKDYRDNLDHLKDSAENLTLAIGQGAAPMIGALASAVGTAVDVFTHLDAVSGGAAGSLLTAGAAALATVGSFSLIAGQAIKVRDRFTTLATDGSRSMTRLGVGVTAAASVIGLASIAIADHAANVSARLAEVGKSADDLARVADDKIAGVLQHALIVGTFAGEDLDETMHHLAETNIEGAQRALDLGAANGLNEKQTIALKKAIDDEKAAMVQAKTTTDEYKGSTDDATAATKLAEDQARATTVANELAKDAIDALKRAHEEAARKVDVFSNSLQGELDKLDALYPKEYDAVQAKYDYADSQEAAMIAVDNMNTTLKDHKSTQEDVKAATDAARDAILQQSEKFATLDGAALGSEGAIRRQIQSLTDQAGTLAPGSPLRLYLEQYIADLAAIPSNVDTFMNLHVSSSAVNPGAPGYSPRNGGARAAGGPVEAGASYLVGEKGPEVVTMAGAGNVTPNSALGGDTYHVANLNVMLPLGTNFDEAVLKSMAKLVRRNGPAVVPGQR